MWPCRMWLYYWLQCYTAPHNNWRYCSLGLYQQVFQKCRDLDIKVSPLWTPLLFVYFLPSRSSHQWPGPLRPRHCSLQHPPFPNYMYPLLLLMHCPSLMTGGKNAKVTKGQENDVCKSIQEDALQSYASAHKMQKQEAFCSCHLPSFHVPVHVKSYPRNKLTS